MTRFEAIRDSKFNTGYGKWVVALGYPIIDFLSGRKYTENVVYGPFRLYNLHADYNIVGYVNKDVRLLTSTMPWDKKDKKVLYGIQWNFLMAYTLPFHFSANNLLQFPLNIQLSKLWPGWEVNSSITLRF